MINNVECRKDGQSVSSGELLASQSEVFETAVFTSTGDEMLSLLKGFSGQKSWVSALQGLISFRSFDGLLRHPAC